MCVCVAVQFVNELLSINMNTLNSIYQNKRDNVCMRRSQNPCRQRFTGTQGKCARLVLKACADNRTFAETAPTNKQGKVCMLRSNSIYQNKRDNVCMRRSQNPCRQRFTGTQGKCARLVLKASADNRTRAETAPTN